MKKETNAGISFFQRYLTVWVFLCMVAGVLLGYLAPALPATLDQLTYARVSIPMAILIWVMIYPMMLKVDFQSIRNVGKNPKGLLVTWVTNWLIKLFSIVPIVQFLLGVSNVSVPFDTLILSVVLFVVIPLSGGILTRIVVTKSRDAEYFENVFVHKFDSVTTVGLLLTLELIFMGQSAVILENPLHIVLIAAPLILQTFLIFFIAYFACKLLNLPHNIAAPAGMIGASNFFELAVAVAVALFGATSPAALATTVGVLTEVPVMLTLVRIANKTPQWFSPAQQKTK